MGSVQVIRVGDQVLTPHLNRWNLPSAGKVVKIDGGYAMVSVYNYIDEIDKVIKFPLYKIRLDNYE